MPQHSQIIALLLAGLVTSSVSAQDVEVLPIRERAALVDTWLDIRLDTIIPRLLRREGIDMWVISAREYNEDPVIKTMLPATWLRARRRTILVFHDPGLGQKVERLAIARYDIGAFQRAWEAGDQ